MNPFSSTKCITDPDSWRGYFRGGPNDTLTLTVKGDTFSFTLWNKGKQYTHHYNRTEETIMMYSMYFQIFEYAGTLEESDPLMSI